MGNFGLGGVLMGRFLPLDCEVHGSVPAATNFYYYYLLSVEMYKNIPAVAQDYYSSWCDQRRVQIL